MSGRPPPRRRRRRAVVLASLVLLTVALAPAAGALADGDPASDVLLGQSVFYPYQPPVSPPAQKKLDAAAAAAARAHFPLKVALIASPVDLGVIPDLFGQPQKYADFLDQEISYQTKQPLLVVMATGYGVAGVPASAKNAVGSLSAPAGKQTDELARAAVPAVAKVASASGHPISGFSGAGGGGSGSSITTILIVVLVLGALATAGALAAVTLRRRRATASG